MTEEQRQQRSRITIAVLAVIFSLMLMRLGHLQIVHGERFALYAEQQRIRPLEIVPPRGDILDRNGVPLATSRPAYTASLVYTGQAFPDEARRLLRDIVGVSDAEIDAALAELNAYPFRRARLRVDLAPREHTLLEEYRHRLPGVIVEALPLRIYPQGTLAAHVLGYLRQLGEWTVQGVAGLEKTYDGPRPTQGGEVLGLAGVAGKQLVEVDATGRLVRVLESQEPRQGNTLRLTLDARLQAAAERALEEEMALLRELKRDPCPCPAPAAAAVVLDVDTGAVLALASRPTYDPNVFALQPFLRRGSERRRQVDEIIQGYIDEGVFLNRAIMSRYPPGSVFKVVTALSGIANGLGGQRLYCPGELVYGGRVFHDWSAHGDVDLVKAIGRSCNVYFWTMGLRLTTERMGATAMELGLHGTTGLLDLEGEAEGRFPFQADPLNTAIGQGAHLYTPLQIASLMASIANGGTRYRPYLVDAVLDPHGRTVYQAAPEVLGVVELPESAWRQVVEGMVGVTTCRSGWCGTAYGRFYDAPYTVAGKTGTVERSGFSSAWNYAWFASFAPAGPGEKPEIAVAVLVEGGGGGSLAAAPVARRIYDVYFGLAPSPLDQVQDLSAHARSNGRDAGHASREGG